MFLHPACSPNLSPIEPVWHNLKKIIWDCPHIPSSIDELKLAVKEAWEAIPITTVDGYIDRMPASVEAVLKAKGSNTGF
jgi:hypothetical protein